MSTPTATSATPALSSPDGALGSVPDTVSQALILSRYQLRDFLRSRRFILMMGIVLGIGVILTAVVGYFRPVSIIDNANDLYSNLGGGLPFIILLAGIIFGGDAIAGEFQNRTGYFLMGLPIKRASVYVGKYLAALVASIVAVVLYILIVMGNAVFYLGAGAFSDPVPLFESVALSVLYLLALLGFVFLFSSLFKTSLYAVIVVAIMFLIGFSILQGVIVGLSHTEPWYLLSYADGVIGYPLTGVPAHIMTVTNPFTHRTTTMYNPTYEGGIGVMLGYFVGTTLGGLFLFEREEFT